MDWTRKISSSLDKISEWSIYLIIFCLPFGKSIVEICIVTALVSLVLKRMLAKENIISENDQANMFLYLLLATSLLSLINSQYLNLSIRAFFSKSLKFAALFLAAREIINTRQKLNNFIIMASISCVIILLDGFIQYFITHVDLLHSYTAFKYRADITGPSFPTASFPFQNDFAAWIIIFIFPVAAFALWAKTGLWNKMFLIALLAGLLYSLILTRVRGAWIGFLAALTFLSIIKLKKIGAVLIIGFILGALFINREMTSAIFSIASDRQSMVKNGLEILKKHPIIGNGINTFFVEYKEIRKDSDRGKRGSYAHNCFLQMACDIGIIGLSFFLAFVAALLIKAFRSLKNIKDPLLYSLTLGLALGIIAFLLHSAVDTNLYSLPLAALFWLSAGILMAAVKMAEAGE